MWPTWGDGGNDLQMGLSGPPGHNGDCNQGHTYAGRPNQICGGDNWGETDLEVWRLATTEELAAAAPFPRRGTRWAPLDLCGWRQQLPRKGGACVAPRGLLGWWQLLGACLARVRDKRERGRSSTSWSGC